MDNDNALKESLKPWASAMLHARIDKIGQWRGPSQEEYEQMTLTLLKAMKPGYLPPPTETPLGCSIQ